MNRKKLAIAVVSGGLISILSNRILSPLINLWLEEFIGSDFWRAFSSYLVSLAVVILLMAALFWGLTMFGLLKKYKR
ncbi:MAG: hypothetical protein VB063_11925 [Bacteroides graminisolvens]|nr:hypothetical protein [Bacteroides graminisolvens]